MNTFKYFSRSKNTNARPVVRDAAFNMESDFPTLVTAPVTVFSQEPKQDIANKNDANNNDEKKEKEFNYKAAVEIVKIDKDEQDEDPLLPGWYRYTIDKTTRRMTVEIGATTDRVVEPVASAGSLTESFKSNEPPGEIEANNMLRTLRHKWKSYRDQYIEDYGYDEYAKMYLIPNEPDPMSTYYSSEDEYGFTPNIDQSYENSNEYEYVYEE